MIARVRVETGSNRSQTQMFVDRGTPAYKLIKILSYQGIVESLSRIGMVCSMYDFQMFGVMIVTFDLYRYMMYKKRQFLFCARMV